MKDDEVVVKIRAVGVVAEMVKVAPDFMRSRIQTDALPLLRKILTPSSSSTSAPVDTMNGYRVVLVLAL